MRLFFYVILTFTIRFTTNKQIEKTNLLKRERTETDYRSFTVVNFHIKYITL